ncbi:MULTISPECIES: hypothetical protein [unclassified Paenibacillus]|uniref:hypothetical protein n=1 Tax=unclassified Paenibacillus TaxID=185978 RepID=UPI0036288E66
MDRWPAEFIRFMERPVPIFIHVAAARRGVAPFSCRGYAARADLEKDQVWICILQSQWLRLNEYIQELSWLAVLLTAGPDNESYQIKGTFDRVQPVLKEDCELMERQRKWTSEYFPHLLPLVAVANSNCLAISLRVRSIYLQTPGPHAGALLTERSH